MLLALVSCPAPLHVRLHERGSGIFATFLGQHVLNAHPNQIVRFFKYDVTMHKRAPTQRRHAHPYHAQSRSHLRSREWPASIRLEQKGHESKVSHDKQSLLCNHLRTKKPRNCAIHTRPFPSAHGGWGLGTRLFWLVLAQSFSK